MIAFLAGLLGLVVGSFLNVVIHRVPLRRSIVWPGSRCPDCGAPIRAPDNVPVVSYALLGGRCRSCKSRISLRYPLVEALTGVLFAAAALRFGFGLPLLSALVLIGTLVALAGIDLEHRLLPNVIVGPAAVAGLALSILINPGAWWVYTVSALAVSGGLFALAIAYPGGMGMGDVKMGGMLGTFLGPYAALAVFLGALVGSVTAGLLMAGGKIDRRAALPFGVFLAVGGILVLFAGPYLWGFYLEFAARLVGGP
ncbi:prepilin peptidase [Rubrobacter tropicus]|uniref:Prepilin peptidase n=1 Tax=Rubrobacter tropicus TaxID=2653851 RepID=A0A6G8Q905_9ACTN|nr:A24 family peptidase [Rubrobacter tropicus]QIN82960.1 prepilin peptidase [Rubrobacter tropicus]